MTECKPNSTIASARVARFICDTLGLSLIDTKERAKDKGPIEKLIIVNGPMAFCDFLPELATLVRRSKQVVWVQQDYTIMPPSANSNAESPFRKVFAELKLRPVFWTTCRNNVITEDDRYINWNQLTYDPHPFRMLSNNCVLYYGAFREKRQESFKRFFTGTCPITVSTTTLRRKKFEAIGANVKFIKPFENVIKEACRFDAALYIEDERSHREFHSPANRFYEMLSAGVPIFFDIRSVKMLREANIIVPEKWQVENAADLEHMYRSTDLLAMRNEQRNLWTTDYVAELKSTLLEIYNEL
jgi:hypothetical protein